MMNIDNWLSEITKGKVETPKVSALDRRREMPDVLRGFADEAQRQDAPVVLMLTPAAARRLAADVEIAVTAFPNGIIIDPKEGKAA